MSSIRVRGLASAFALAAASACFVLATDGTAVAAEQREVVPYSVRQELFASVQKWIGELTEEKNEFGKSIRKVAYSRSPRKVDDSTYTITVHVNTARETEQLTERYLVTLKRDPAARSWTIANKELKESYVGLYRSNGGACYPFDKLSFSREGMTVTGTKGTMCEGFLQGDIFGFFAHSNDLAYKYDVPDHATEFHSGHDFYAMQELFAKDHSRQLALTPAYVSFDCDPRTCEELITSIFTGLTRVTPEKRKEFTIEDIDLAGSPPWYRKIVEDGMKQRREDAFAGFRTLDAADHRRYSIYIPNSLSDDHDAVWLDYDSWGGFEVQFGVRPKRWDLPDQLVGPLYGYYTEQTLQSVTPEELERREEASGRWFEVKTLSGTVDLALEDPEMLHGDVEFGLTIKQDTRELPFFIISNNVTSTEKDNRSTMSVNSIELNDEELTWVQSSPYGGNIILPGPMKAGTEIRIRMNFATKALYKLNHSYTRVNRGGWIPFVSFGDRIDDFELTIRAPSKYKVIGIGKKAEEKIEGETVVSHWEAQGVNFPTIIFGRYRSDRAGFDAKKLDGDPILVEVHVDEASFGDWGIAPKYPREIAEQAVNSINLYTAISGLDYPFGALNLVNDPEGFLYGQAPSSIIYLGSGVFKGEGELAPYFQDASYIARFKRSVTPHEVGHQWWGNTISNANQRNYWFVESLAEYFSALYLEFAFGWNEYMGKVEGWRRNILDSELKSTVQNASVLFTGERGFPDYQTAVYNKGPYAFHVLRETFKGEGPRGNEGADARFFAALKSFSMELADKREITTFDMQHALERAFGGVDEEGNPYTVDLSWFFDQWVRGSGLPRFILNYDVRQSEDGGWIIEGTIDQTVTLGTSDHVIANRVYRGFVDLTVEAKGGPFRKRFVLQEAKTPFALKVPSKPLEVVLNKDGEMLAHDVTVR